LNNQNQNQNQSQNQFSGNRNNAFSNNQPTSFGMNRLGGSGPFQTRQAANARRTYDLDADRIRADFTKERPIWPFSSYGPTVDQPKQLIEGDVEISPEEMRCRAYLAKAQGRPPAEVNDVETAANAKMTTFVQEIINDTMAAIRYVRKGEDEHPNRWDVMSLSVEGGLEKLKDGSQPPSSFGQSPNAAQATASPFGAPSNAAAFGKPSFGQPSLPAASPFGAAAKPSPFGQPSASTASPFGQAAATTSSPFGQAANPAFGQPSAINASPFGQAVTNASPFGQAAKPAGSAFGQPSNAAAASPFGQVSATPSAGFGQASTLGGNSAFGKPSVPGTSAFGQPSGFGQPSALNNASPFPNAAAGNPSTPFGQPSILNAPAGPAAMNTNNSPFGQTGQNNGNASPFGQSNGNANLFGANQTSTANAFGSPSPFGQNNANAAPPNNSPFGSAVRSSAANVNRASPFGSTSAAMKSGSLNIASNTKIFPTGVPTAPLCEDPSPYQYAGNEGQFKEAYDQAKQNGTFTGEVMPLVAPKFEWVSFQV
jgi:nucleoporin NUP42